MEMDDQDLQRLPPPEAHQRPTKRPAKREGRKTIERVQWVIVWVLAVSMLGALLFVVIMGFVFWGVSQGVGS